MSENNRTLLRKAEIAVSDFSPGGLLQPAQVDRFIRLAIKKPVLMQRCTVTPMTAMKEERDKTRFANRVLHAGQEATALPSASWAKPTQSMVQLDVQLFKAEARISYEALEDQIERSVFKDTLLSMLAEAIGRDMEWIAINGDTASADPTLAKLDGILKQITSWTVNGLSAKLTKAILRDMYRLMPDEFSNDDMLEYFTNKQAQIDYRDSLADRLTPMGDSMLQSKGTPAWSDMNVNKVGEFPVDGSSNTQVVLVNPQGIFVGFYRKVRLQVTEDISAGNVIIVATVRFDVKLAEETAVVKAYAVKGA